MTEPQFVDGLSESTPTLRPVGGIGLAAAIMIGIAAAVGVATTVTSWNSYQVLRDYLAGEPGVTEADLEEADGLALPVIVGYWIALVGAGVLFVVWLWRARRNAEAMCHAEHRRARGWIIWSWICPIVNLWFPYMIVDDVYRASQPDNPRDLHNLGDLPVSNLLGGWWATFLGAWILNRIADRMWQNAVTVEAWRTSVIIETVATAALIVAAVTIVMIMRRISIWQTPR